MIFKPVYLISSLMCKKIFLNQRCFEFQVMDDELFDEIVLVNDVAYDVDLHVSGKLKVFDNFLLMQVMKIKGRTLSMKAQITKTKIEFQGGFNLIHILEVV